MENFYNVEIKGTARDAHERYPITFNVSGNGTPFFNGCDIHVVRKVGTTEITDRVSIRAFGEVAEELAGVSDGAVIHIKGEFGRQKRGEKYYDIITVREVVDIQY